MPCEEPEGWVFVPWVIPGGGSIFSAGKMPVVCSGAWQRAIKMCRAPLCSALWGCLGLGAAESRAELGTALGAAQGRTAATVPAGITVTE